MVVGRVGMKSALRDPAWARQQQDRVRGKLELEGGDPEETGITKIRQKKRGQLLGVTQDACALASSLFLSFSLCCHNLSHSWLLQVLRGVVLTTAGHGEFEQVSCSVSCAGR